MRSALAQENFAMFHGPQLMHDEPKSRIAQKTCFYKRSETGFFM